MNKIEISGYEVGDAWELSNRYCWVLLSIYGGFKRIEIEERWIIPRRESGVRSYTV